MSDVHYCQATESDPATLVRQIPPYARQATHHTRRSVVPRQSREANVTLSARDQSTGGCAEGSAGSGHAVDSAAYTQRAGSRLE